MYMEKEEVFRWIINFSATLFLVWGLKTEYNLLYMLCTVPLGLSYLICYSLTKNNPKIKWFNTTICYLAFCCFLALPGLMHFTKNVGGAITVMLSVIGILCCLDAYVPIIAYHLGYRSSNKLRYPTTVMVLIEAAFFISVFE